MRVRVPCRHVQSEVVCVVDVVVTELDLLEPANLEHLTQQDWFKDWI